MTFNLDKSFGGQDKAGFERETARAEAEQKLQEFDGSLDQAVLELRQNSNDADKREALVKILEKLRFWDGWKGAKFADAYKRQNLLKKVSAFVTEFSIVEKK